MHLQLPPGAFRLAYRLLTAHKPRDTLSYPGTPRVQVFTGTQAQPVAPAATANTLTSIPARIWTYWHSATLDPVVQQCIANWRRHCPGLDVQVIHAHTLGDVVDAGDLPPAFAALPAAKQADWLRLYVVRKFGGYWLDASTLLTQSLAWLDDLRQTQGAEFVGFYIDGYTTDLRYPIIESWAFGAPAGEPFMTAWQQEFHRALIEEGEQRYLQALQAQAGGRQVLQGITDPAYLLIHVAAQQVLRRPNGFRLALLRAEDTAFFYQQAVWWKWYLLYPRLCLVPAEPHPAPLIKLRGGERRHFAKLLQGHGGAAPGSVWQRATTATGT
jgi:Mannosyltransferase OCH1 and related enzymes